MSCAWPACAGSKVSRTPTRALGPSLPSPSRRAVNLQLITLLGSAALLEAGPAQAGLVAFPANKLNNQYLLVRAGESVAESQGYVLSNPVAKTSIDCGLSEAGKAQVRTLEPGSIVARAAKLAICKACLLLGGLGRTPNCDLEALDEQWKSCPTPCRSSARPTRRCSSWARRTQASGSGRQSR
jgi:hypothetical protein